MPSHPSLFQPESSTKVADHSATDWIHAHCDGGARGNPGPAGFGALIQDHRGNVLAELSEFLGIRTNNYAEYSGLLAVLQYTLDNHYPRLRVVSDSELMVKQMRGEYRVKNDVLRGLHAEASALARQLDGVEFRHVLRAHNELADRLVNEALDAA